MQLKQFRRKKHVPDIEVLEVKFDVEGLKDLANFLYDEKRGRPQVTLIVKPRPDGEPGESLAVDIPNRFPAYEGDYLACGKAGEPYVLTAAQMAGDYEEITEVK